MQKPKVFLLTTLVLTTPFLAVQNAWGQAIGEFGGVNAGVAGMGAGLAASMGHGELVRKTYESAAQAQQALAAQNKAVEQYYKLGNQFELKKQWDCAEKAFTYVLQVIARRDGPGSPKSVPALKHLASISQSQNRLDQAISYQKTILAFTRAAKVPDKPALVQESVALSNLFIKKADYPSAEPLLRDSVALGKETMPPADYQRTLRVYGKVLRQLNKPQEAQQVEAELQETALNPPSSAPEAAAAPSTETSSSAPGRDAAETAPQETGEAWNPANNEPEPDPTPLPMPISPQI